jgi:hypothetical protein
MDSHRKAALAPREEQANPEEDPPDEVPDPSGGVPTGKRQAALNRENDPPV